VDRGYGDNANAMTPISVTSVINAPREKVWRYYTEQEHIMQWNAASDDWHCPRAENDLRVGGKFMSRMEARDGSQGFDFEGIYTEVVPEERLAYAFGDRSAVISFDEANGQTKVTVTFDPENENPIEMQRGGWQAILDRFKHHVESN
jgi:uncharacterized protein YndB with AHSA1/START domain